MTVPAEGLKNSAGDLGRVGVAGQLKIAEGDAAQAGNGEIERVGGEAFEDGHSIQPPPNTSSPE